MARRQSDQRSTRFYGVFSDPWRKLISVGLGILLWYYLNASITKTHRAVLTLQFKQESRANHVEIKLNSTSYAHRHFLDGDTRQLLTGITLELKGGNRVIDEFEKPGQLMFEVKFTESDVRKSDPPFLVFRLEDIHHKSSPEYDKLLSSMTPRTVLIELERNASKNLLLSKANVELTLENGIDKERIQDPIFEPRHVKVFGPDDQIQRIGNDTRLFTGAVSAQQIKTVTELSIQLQLAKEFEQAGIQVEAPYVTYKVEPERTQFLLKGVPVMLDTAQVKPEEAAAFEVKQKTVDILIRGSGDLHAALFNHIAAGQDLHEVPPSWCQEHARLRVYLRPENLNQDTIPPRKPTLELFQLDPLDQVERRYLPGPDFVVPEPSRKLIDIVKKKG